MKTAIVCTMMVMSAGAASAQAVIGGDWRADIAAFAQRAVTAGLTPGVSVAVAAEDWVIYAEGFGMADVGHGRAVTGDSPFYIASTTKSLTATAAAVAAHEKKLDFSRPMLRYLPAAKLHADVPRERITVHHLAALTHGLNGNGPVVLRTAYTGEFTDAQLLDLLRLHEPAGEFGSFNYNNLGFNLLGMVLASIYKSSWKDVVRQLVLDPIGMTATTANVSDVPLDRIALPHDVTVDGWQTVPVGKEDSNMHAAGGHFASARDLARYLAAHITNGIVEGKRVLPAEALQLTHQQQVSQKRRFGRYLRHGWGYGWDIGTSDGDTLLHRFGGFGGYRSHLSFMPQHGVGVVVLVNGSGPASDAADVIADFVYDRVLSRTNRIALHNARLDSLSTRARALRSTDLPEHLAERRARLKPLPHPLADYAGIYESPALGRMVWRVVAGGLELRMGAVHSRAEVYNAAENRLRIEVGGSGQVVEFIFPPNGGAATGARMAGFDFARVQR